jgi:NADH:ubiquinone oxidoreductase subunit E
MLTDKPDNACQCTETAPPEELRRRLDEVITDYKDKPGGLIPVLQIAQGLFGYLPDEVVRQISTGLDKPYSEVAGVITFYSFFSTRPRGEHMVRVCLGTACYVRGGKQVLDAFKKELGIDVGETTPDRKYTLEVARCFGACGLAPAITIDDEVHQRVKPTKIREILAKHMQPATVAKGA